MLDEGHKAVRVVISGRVQGVWFRGWTVEQATMLDVDGWVRNRVDGTVETLIVGPEELVDQLVALCHKGPRLAKVENVEIQNAMGITPKGFSQKPTVDIEKRRN